MKCIWLDKITQICCNAYCPKIADIVDSKCESKEDCKYYEKGKETLTKSNQK